MAVERWMMRRLACGCWLGYERCFDCRPGLDIDQEKAIAITLAKLADPPPTVGGMED